MKLLIAISDGLDRISKYLVTLFLGIMTVALFSQVVSRYVFNTGLTWSEELSRYLMVWMVFLGAAIATKEGTQISVTVLEELLPSSFKKWLFLLQKLVVIAFMALIALISTRTMEIAKMQTSPNMALPMNIVYLVIPIASVLMILHLLLGIYLDFRGDKK